MVSKRFIFGVFACALVVLVAACAPKGPPAVSLTEKTCREAAFAESSATVKMSRATLAQAELTDREAALIELQRLKSRIVTGRMSDEELVQWGVDTTKAEEPAPADTSATETAGSDSLGATTDSVSTEEPRIEPMESDTTGGISPAIPEAEGEPVSGESTVEPAAAEQATTETPADDAGASDDGAADPEPADEPEGSTGQSP